MAVIALTRAQAAYKAWNMAANGLSEDEVKLSVVAVEFMIDEAALKLCEELAEEPMWYQYIQTNFTITVSNGVGSFPDPAMAMTAVESRGGLVTMPPYIKPLSYISTRTALFRPRPGGSDIAYFNVRGGGASPGSGQLYISDSTGTGLSGTATVLCCGYVAFANLHANLQDAFLQVLTRMAREKMRLATPHEADGMAGDGNE